MIDYKLTKKRRENSHLFTTSLAFPPLDGNGIDIETWTLTFEIVSLLLYSIRLADSIIQVHCSFKHQLMLLLLLLQLFTACRISS